MSSEAMSERKLEEIAKRAEFLEANQATYEIPQVCEDCLTLVAEVRRSHAENAELRETVEQLKTHLDTYAERLGEKQQENAELRERVGELEGVLRRIKSRFKREDDGAFLKDGRAGRIAWAMWRDAEVALSPKQEEEE